MSSRIEVQVDINPNDIVGAIDNLLDEQTMIELHTILAEMVNPYVPYKTGALSGSDVVIDSEAVHYTSSYAKYQYYGTEFNHTLDPHPKATAFWDRVMLNEQGDEFITRVKEVLSRRAKELYG